MFTVLHIADFALHAVLRTEPATADSAAALFAGTSRKSVVLAASPAARAAGVELGMTAPQALARCARLVIRSPQPAAEADARAALLAVGFTLSPLIEDTAPGVCTADVRGLEAKSLPAAARAAVQQLAALGLPATAGLAATPLLALYAARAAETHRSRSLNRSRSLLPHIAERTKNENEERERFEPVLPIADPAPFLAPLPLAAADPSPELAAILHGWGVRTLGDLTALPRDEIVRRFGAAGLTLWQRAAGGAPRPLHPVIAPQTFSAEMKFEDEIETLEPLLFLLRRFLDRLSLELRASQHVATELELVLHLVDDTRHARTFRLPAPTADVEILFRTLHTHLESLQTAAAISAVHLALTPARPLVRQQDLFETGLRDPHGFVETLARISALVGAGRIGTPRLEDTHRPDAVNLVPPLAVVPPSAASAAGGPEPVEGLHPPLGAPLRRFRPPLLAGLTDTDDGKTYLWADGLRGEVSFRSPPYHRSGDWWQADRAWARIEWDIALAEGGLYRLVLVGEDYFIEGEYD